MGQTFIYEFDEGFWPASPTGIVDGGDFTTPDDVFIFNDSGNNMFFDSQYQVVGNGARITNEAMWGNPLDLGGGVIDIDFFSIGKGAGVNTVAFDFAWAEAGVPASPDTVFIYVEDSQGRADFSGYVLGDSFTGFGGAPGFEDRLVFDASNLVDNEMNFDGGPFDDIVFLEIFVDEIAFGGNNSEYAIDNFSVNGAVSNASNVFPSFNNGQDGSGGIFVRNILDDTGTTSITQAITNDGGDATTVSTAIVPGGDLNDANPLSMAPINPGQTIFAVNVMDLDTNAVPTGEYESSLQVINDTNGADPTDTITHRVRVHEPASLTINNGVPVQVDQGEMLSIENAAAPVGGFRAGVEVEGAPMTTGDFTVTGFNPTDETLPGETDTATVGFSRFGRLSGVYNGTHTISIKSVSQSGFFLLNATPLPDIVWDLEYDLQDNLADNASVVVTDSFDELIGVNRDETAVTLIDGTATKSQTLNMVLAANPEDGDPTMSATLAAEPVDFTFSGSPDLYVMQFTYVDGNVPFGSAETDLIFLTYDFGTQDWVDALSLNSDGGAGAGMFTGSYADFLAGPGGGGLDLGDLSMYGIDAANNMAWAVLDHASVFGLGVLGAVAIPGDADGDGDVDLDDFNILAANFGLGPNAPGGFSIGDFDEDGDVDLNDFNLLAANFGIGTEAVGGLPEPGTVGLLALGAAALRRRHP